MPGYRETLDRIVRGDFDQASGEEKAQAVRQAINVCAIASAAVAVQPFPLVDVALLAPIQIALVQAVGRVHGYKLDKRSVLEILSTFGASLVAQAAILAATKLIPVLGWIVGMAMAYALTYAIGEVSDYYFRNGRGVPKEELRAMFKRIYEEKKKERQAAYKSSKSLKQRLEELKEARADGLLTDEEFERKKEEILKDF